MILPDVIATHFDISGKVDSYGSKLVMFLLPTIGTVLFAGLLLVNKYPYKFNYPAKITYENALKQYTLATKIIRFLKSSIMILFDFIVVMIYSSSSGKSDGSIFFIIPIIILLILAPTFFYIYKSHKAK